MDSERRIAQLEAKVEELTRLLTQAEPRLGEVVPAESSDSTHSSRRGMFKVMGAAAVGAVASSVAFARPAAATTDEALLTGHANNGTQQTQLNYGGAINGPVNGNRGPNLTGTIAMMRIDAGASPSTDTVGLDVVGRGVGIQVLTSGSFAVQANGGDFSFASGVTNKANLFLRPNNNVLFFPFAKTPPLQRTDSHLVGEIDNVAGDLWMCVAAGTPGTWKKITGPAAAGAFHAISPARVYDSRSPVPSTGILAAALSRTVSVADKRDLGTGAVVTADTVRRSYRRLREPHGHQHNWRRLPCHERRW